MKNQLFVKLRAEIADLHDVAETHSPLHRIVTGSLSENQYVEILKHLYTFASEIEPMALQKISPHLSEEELNKLSRMPSLKNDLDYFNVNSSSFKYPPKQVTIDTPSQALGWFYLSEGSRLGGQVLSHSLKDQYGINHQSGAAYFSSEGQLIANIHQQWDWFQKLTIELLPSEKDQDSAIKTARIGFGQLNDWFNNLQL